MPAEGLCAFDWLGRIYSIHRLGVTMPAEGLCAFDNVVHQVPVMPAEGLCAFDQRMKH